MKAHLHLESWAGKTSHPVTIIRETPKRYLVELEETCPKGYKYQEVYVPKHSITIDKDHDQ